ncbi:MAG: TolB family protein [Sporichthyaceae bacterium]
MRRVAFAAKVMIAVGILPLTTRSTHAARTFFRRVGALAAVGALCTTATWGLAAAAAPATPVELEARDTARAVSALSGKIVFSFKPRRNPDADIVVINADGSGRKVLTSGPDADFEPRFSPDGKRIVFTRDFKDARPEIFVMNADGSGLRRLTRHPGFSGSPSFSPDGKRIAFLRGTVDTAGRIIVMNADGSGQRPVTTVREVTAISWSGSDRLVFEDSRPAGKAIFSIRTDGTDRRALTKLDSRDRSPRTSADGTKIAFIRTVNFGKTTCVWIMNVDGSSQRQITRGSEARDPAFSPDGRTIVFQSNRDEESSELYTVGVNSKKAARLTTNKRQFEDSPDWS